MSDNKYTVERMTRQEIEEEYPLISKVLQNEYGGIDMRRVTGFAVTNSPFLFAPALERALRDSLKDNLWAQFNIKVSVKRKRKKKDGR